MRSALYPQGTIPTGRIDTDDIPCGQPPIIKKKAQFLTDGTQLFHQILDRPAESAKPRLAIRLAQRRHWSRLALHIHQNAAQEKDECS